MGRSARMRDTSAQKLYTSEEDLLMELVGRKKRPTRTERKWTRIDISLHASLPYGTSRTEASVKPSAGCGRKVSSPAATTSRSRRIKSLRFRSCSTDAHLCGIALVDGGQHPHRLGEREERNRRAR
jgi:hypothetical protein